MCVCPGGRTRVDRRASRHKAAEPIGGDAGFEQLIYEKLMLLRGTCASIVDDAEARMPLAYVHLGEILVDALVILAPFALYSKLGVFMVPLCGLQTIFYHPAWPCAVQVVPRPLWQRGLVV